MHRRTLLATAAAAVCRPALAQSPSARVLRFVPQANPENLDPVWAPTIIARNHAFLVWDQLYANNRALEPRPQMVAGHEVLDDGRRWRFTLRDGLAFHDGTPARGVDCVASIQRAAQRRNLGQKLLERADELRATSDTTFEIRLKQPFRLTTTALADIFVMPERLASVSPFKLIPDYMGSGPFRFVADEFVSGSRAVYVRNDKYLARNEPPDGFAGGKVVHFDRVEWRVMPDSASAAAALQNNEVDWLETPLHDLLPMLRKSRGVRVFRNDELGSMAIAQFNHLHPPFNNRKLLAALLPAIDQSEFMQAAYGEDGYVIGVGVFTPNTAMATSVGLDVLTGPRDLARARALVAASGYAGERAVVMAPADQPATQAITQVLAETMKTLGINVDYVSMDFGTLVQRRAKRDAVEAGGWSAFCTYFDGISAATPATNSPLRGNGTGPNAWFGWADDPEMESARDAWFDAPDLPAQKAICDKMQLLAFQHVPFIPLGQRYQDFAARDDLQDIVKSFLYPVFWGVRRA
ncbi:MAG TPA: ABC transporter substrate-binding protein [Acidisphaera sp.]|nr:ABC transporter substrate-binding protein [Acidisphaera sp.]